MCERYLIRFSQQGALKYIGHLDLLRVFQQTIRRSGLPAAYSQGFNPHILLSFALPLPLGMASVHDYAEIVLEKSVAPEAIQQSLNDSAPAGLMVTGVKPAGAGRAAAVTAAADYAYTPPQNEDTAEILRMLLAETAIIVPKKTKSGVRDTDIRPDIFDLRLETEPELHVIMRLAAGSARFLNPKLVLSVMQERLGHSETEDSLTEDLAVPGMTRLELYRFDGSFIPLFTS